MAPLDGGFIHRLIGEEPSWLYRKEWDSYPRLGPISSFAPVEPMKGFHYLGAMEPWVSTYVPSLPSYTGMLMNRMETQTISAREAVARQVQDWWGLGLGECRGGADAWDWSCEE
jgi:prenylcysteine oxidase/farnesylcysteine lyase